MIGDFLRLHEELVLLGRTENGRRVGNGQHANALGAAVLAELLLNKRVLLEVVKKKLVVRMVDTRLLGDAVIDEASEKLRVAKRPLPASDWVVRFARLPRLLPRITERLWLSGLLRREERPFLLLFRRMVYLTAHPLPRQRLIARLRTAVLSDDAIDERTATLLVLAHANGLLSQALDRQQLKPRKRRIKELVEGQPIAQALAKAIASSNAAG